MSDKRAIACNLLRTRSESAKGSLAYVSSLNGGAESIAIVLRSRSGRWIRIYERLRYLGNFRTKTIPPEHPRYGDYRIMFNVRKDTELASGLAALADRNRRHRALVSLTPEQQTVHP